MQPSLPELSFPRLLFLIVMFISTPSSAQDKLDPIALAWSFFESGCGLVVSSSVSEFGNLVSSPLFRVESTETTDDERITRITFVAGSDDPSFSVEYVAQWIDHAELEIRRCTMQTTNFDFEGYEESKRTLRELLHAQETEYLVMEFELPHSISFDVSGAWHEVEVYSNIQIYDNVSTDGTVYGFPDTSIYFSAGSKIRRTLEDRPGIDSN